MAEDTPLQEHARRAASALTIALFGSLALLHLTWSGWCLGWLGTAAAANLMVVGSLTLLGGYGIQLARYHRILALPPFSAKEMLFTSGYWVFLALLVLKGLWPQGGFVGGLSGPLAILEGMLLFLLLRQFRDDLPGQALALATAALHLLGWLLLGWLFLHFLDLYLAPLFQEEGFRLTAGFLPGVNARLEALVRPGALLPALLALLAIAASWLLRLHLFRRRLAAPCPLLHKGAWCALGLFLFALLFSTATFAFLKKEGGRILKEAQAEEAALKAQEAPLAEGTLSLRQKDLGTLLAEISRLQASQTPSPLHWDAFLQAREEAPDTLPWPLPEEASGEDGEVLRDLRRQMTPALEALDALEASLEEAPRGALTPGVFLLEQWRFLHALQANALPDAQASLQNFHRLLLHGLQSDSLSRRRQAFAQTKAWLSLARLLPTAFCRPMAATLLEALENAPDGKALQEQRRQALLTLGGTLPPPAGLEAPSWLLPFPAMVALADAMALDRAFRNAQGHPQEVKPPRGFCGFYTRFTCFLLSQDYQGLRLQTMGLLETYLEDTPAP